MIPGRVVIDMHMVSSYMLRNSFSENIETCRSMSYNLTEGVDGGYPAIQFISRLLVSCIVQANSKHS